MFKKKSIIVSLTKKFYKMLFLKHKLFPGSEEYWNQRYNSGGDSGFGSNNHLAEFKAEIINDFVKNNDVRTIIEYGCGDGNQLKLAEYPSYIGFDISPKAIKSCDRIFQDDQNKKFKLMYKENIRETANLTLSLDVIYHLIEDDIYHSYMELLFDSSKRFVIIYSSNYDEEQRYQIKRRHFTKWVEKNRSQWKLIHHIPNRFPYNGDIKASSRSDFYIYKKD